MMGKTHIVAGIATALAFVQPKTTGECMRAILGGAIGGLISDLDAKNSKSAQDARVARILLVMLITVVLLVSRELDADIWGYIRQRNDLFLGVTGTGLFIAACTWGRTRPHRSFMHSLMALAILSLSVYWIYKPVMLYFQLGFLSHIALDMLNKQPVLLLYPWHRGICLKLCYAGRTADKIFLILGTSAALLMLLRVYFPIGI